MRHKLKRAISTLAVVAMVAGVVQIFSASPASAAGTLQGAAAIKTPGGSADKQSGNSTSPGGDFTLRLPSGAACEGDSPNDGYRWQTYMVPSSVDPSTLTFDGDGPIPLGTGASFRQPLYQPNSNPTVDQNTAAAITPPGPGPIINIPDFTFQYFTPGQVPAGVYNLGIACTLGSASGTQMKSFWNVQMTISADTTTGGPAQIHWENGTAPGAPTISGVTPQAVVAATGQASVAFTTPAANPALTNCAIVVGTSAGGSQFGTFNGACTSPRTVTGLTYGQQYFFRLTSTNAVGTSPVSNEVSATAVRPAVANLGATPSPNTVTLNWDDAALLGSDSYNVTRCTLPATSPCTSASAGYVATVTRSTSDATIGSLVSGQLYTFTVTYGAAGTSGASSVQSTPLSNSILLQDITVGRPNGALVLTQVCGKYDAMTAEAAQFGFPTGLGASSASVTGTMPAGETAPKFAQYPYPENADGTPNATYPTTCGISLGNAHLVTQGGSAMGAGQFFAASGRLNQVSVVDTRDTDDGWAINFTMGNLTNGVSQISGNELGWTAQKTDTPSFLDGFGNSYDQNVGYVTPSMTPNTQGSAGAGTGHTVISAPAGSGLGIATLDARIKFLIPIHARNGNYTGTLTINAL